MAVDDVIALSPNYYFAGIIEESGPVQCEVPPGKTEICWTTARVLEVFAAKTPDGSPFSETFKLFASGPAGRKLKGISALMAVPTRHGDVFGAKLRSSLARPDSPTDLRALVRGSVAAPQRKCCVGRLVRLVSSQRPHSWLSYDQAIRCPRMPSLHES
jgi:hypothetical protein